MLFIVSIVVATIILVLFFTYESNHITVKEARKNALSSKKDKIQEEVDRILLSIKIASKEGKRQNSYIIYDKDILGDGLSSHEIDQVVYELRQRGFSVKIGGKTWTPGVLIEVSW